MAVLKAMTSGGVRRELDFYPTPPEATRALLPLIETWPGRVWEPCCGEGAITKVLETKGFEVINTDIVDHGQGSGSVRDFFTTVRSGFWPETIITNPPFNRADDFIRHAHALGTRRMALLLKIDFWNAKMRIPLWNMWRPYLIAPLTWRLDFTGQKKPHTNCMWCLWDHGYYGLRPAYTKFEPLQKPQDNIMSEAA